MTIGWEGVDGTTCTAVAGDAIETVPMEDDDRVDEGFGVSRGEGGDTITSVGDPAETTPTSRANGSEPTSAADSVAGDMSALGEAAVEFVVSGSTSTGVMMSMFGVGGLDGTIKVLTCRGRGAAALSEELRGEGTSYQILLVHRLKAPGKAREGCRRSELRPWGGTNHIWLCRQWTVI